MNSPGSSFLLQQLPFVVPILLVCLGGFAVAAINLNRHFSAAALTMVGTGLLILAALGVMVAQFLLIHQGVTPSSRQLMQVVAVGGSLARALGTALVIAAVFVGRSQSGPFQTPPAYPQQPFAK